MEKDINLEKKDSADSVKQSTSKRQNTDATTALDEERIHSSIDSSIRPADVLCGRGKPSFNHSK